MKYTTQSLLISTLLLSNTGFAANLGNIEITSAFREPLNVNIPILNTAESSPVNVKLAENYAYLNARTQRVKALDAVNTTLTKDEAGQYYVSLTSETPINELFLELIVDVSMEDERLSRKYTVLLDPADYNPKAINKIVKAPVRKLTKVEPVKIKQESHSMESHVGDDSHDMKGSSEESHSMESHVGDDSHDMKGSSEESHSMESHVGDNSHDMKGSSEESHSMESHVGDNSHDMKGSVH